MVLKVRLQILRKPSVLIISQEYDFCKEQRVWLRNEGLLSTGPMTHPDTFPFAISPVIFNHDGPHARGVSY